MKMTHRKLIISGLIGIAVSNLLIFALGFLLHPEQASVLERMLNLTTNIASALGGMYMGRSMDKQGEERS